MSSAGQGDAWVEDTPGVRREMRDRGRMGWAAWAGALALYVAAALGGTWPLAQHVTTHLPTGSLESGTVPLFNLWTLEWNARSLAQGYRGYWDAPIFYPTSGSFGLSEAQALTGLGFAAASPVFGAVTAYNLILLVTLVLNAFSARRLLRILGAPVSTATALGLLALGMPFVWKELGVLQLTACWPVWLALGEIAIIAHCAGALAPSRSPSTSERDGPASTDAQRAPDRLRARAIWRLAIWCAALVWTCTYYALFFAVFLLLAAVFFARRDLLRPPLRAACLGASLLLLAASSPLIAQQRVVTGYSRSTKTIHDGGATARAYVRLPRDSVGGRILPFAAGMTGKRSLSPGWLTFTLCVLGGFALLSKRSPLCVRVNANWRRFVVWCAVCAGLALMLSFGARWWIGPVRPYELIVERYWPGFGNARSPYRFGMFVQVFVLVFAGVGLEWARGALFARALRPVRGVLLLAAAVVCFLEVMPVSSRLMRFPREALSEPWIAFLAQHPGGAVAMVPPAMSGDVAAFEPTTVAMLQALHHGHPLLNGYSGFFPRLTDAYLDSLREFPNRRSKRALARVPIRYAVVDKVWLASRPDLDLAPLTRVFDSPTRAIYLVSSAR